MIVNKKMKFKCYINILYIQNKFFFKVNRINDILPKKSKGVNCPPLTLSKFAFEYSNDRIMFLNVISIRPYLK